MVVWNTKERGKSWGQESNEKCEKDHTDILSPLHSNSLS